MSTDPLTWLGEVLDAMTPANWRGRAFSDGRGGVWHEPSSAAVFLCPNVEHADLTGTATLRNLAPAMLAVIETARLLVQAQPGSIEEDERRAAAIHALTAFNAAVREEQQRHA